MRDQYHSDVAELVSSGHRVVVQHTRGSDKPAGIIADNSSFPP